MCVSLGTSLFSGTENNIMSFKNKENKTEQEDIINL